MGKLEKLKAENTVAVLMGGPSSEHAISLKSGAGVAAALRSCGWTVHELVIPASLGFEEAGAWTTAALKDSGCTVAFIALHGAFGEDGTVQALCENLDLAYTGSDVGASRLGMDKIASRLVLEKAGIRVPPWKVLTPADDPAPVLDALNGPWVVKPTNQGSSIGISLVLDVSDARAALGEAFRYGEQAIVESYIAGHEVTVGVLGKRALPVVGIVPEEGFFDFSAKYTKGKTRYEVPASLDAGLAKVLRAIGYAAHQALGCRHLSRTDLILDAAGGSVVLEVNTVPGFTPTSLLPMAASCEGVSYEQVCEQIVCMSIADHASKVLR